MIFRLYFVDSILERDSEPIWIQVALSGKAFHETAEFFRNDT
jgi:hypothetical protein